MHEKKKPCSQQPQGMNNAKTIAVEWSVVKTTAGIYSKTSMTQTPMTRLPIMKTRLFKYTVYRKFHLQKSVNFQIQKLWYFPYVCSKHTVVACSLELPHQGSSNEYWQSMFLSRNKKNNVYPCKLQFYYIKVGFKGVKIL